jgi:hypothetical protein
MTPTTPHRPMPATQRLRPPGVPRNLSVWTDGPEVVLLLRTADPMTGHQSVASLAITPRESTVLRAILEAAERAVTEVTS